MPALVPTIRGALFLTPWLVQLLVADVLLSALLPVSAFAPTFAYDLSSWIAFSVWRGIQYMFTNYNGAKIIVAGDKLPQGETAIVISNHVEWTDFYMIQELALKAGMLSRCRWFAKQQLKWVPFLGWGLWAMGMPLVSRKWMQDEREIKRVFGGVIKQHWPMWLIAYSEATRFTKQKREEGLQWCKANDKVMPKNLLYPRTRGFIASVQGLRKVNHVKAVYDVTIAYAKSNQFQKPPTFSETVFTPHLDKLWKFYVHVQRHNLEDLPSADAELADWLVERWIQKGEKLEALKNKLARGESWEE